METDKTLADRSNTAPTPAATDEPEVEGHYMSQLAAEQEALLRQHRLLGSAERAHQQTGGAPEANGIIERIRRRLDR
jgi:hypothetical protein